MYKHILIPTGASELADKVVERGITLAKEIGAKITVPTISVPFHILTTNAQMIEDTAPQYKRRMAEQAAKILKAVADAASAAKRGVARLARRCTLKPPTCVRRRTVKVVNHRS